MKLTDEWPSLKQFVGSEKDEATDELHTLHPLVTDARWLFGPEFDTPEYASNVSIRNAVEKTFKERLDSTEFINAKKRPDLIILKDASSSAVALEAFDRNSDIVTMQEILLIEIKRGKSAIGREEMYQAEGYVQDILVRVCQMGVRLFDRL